MASRWPKLSLVWLVAFPATVLPQAALDNPERREEVRREFERIEELPPAEQEKEIPRVYREMHPDLFSVHFGGEQPKLIIRPGKQPYFVGVMCDRSRELLAAHVQVVRPLIRVDLRSGDRARVGHAVRTIGWLRSHEFYDEVVTAFRQGVVEWSAVATLRDLNDPRAIRVILEKHPRDPLRYFEVLRSLCTKRPADPVLVKLLRSEDAKTRWQAAYALTESGDPTLAPEVERLAKDPDPEVREQAARMGSCLAMEGVIRSRPVLLAQLSDKDVNVRLAAARGLAAGKDKACARTLLDLLKDDSLDELLHAQVRTAVQSLAGTHFGYYHGSDGWKPTTEKNKVAIRRFTEWVETIEKKES
jgi:hypothetical protein